MDSQILYLIIGVLVGAIAIYFFVKKNGSTGDNSVLSSQLADLIIRFSKVEEATKNISSTQVPFQKKHLALAYHSACLQNF